MSDKLKDKSTISNNDETSRFIKDNGQIIVPGTTILSENRGAEPAINEYVDIMSEEGITSDSNKIAHLRAKKEGEVVNNEMLGSFNNQGVYKVSNEISLELVNMVKVLTTPLNELSTVEVDGVKLKMLPNVVYCESAAEFGGIGKFKFAIQTYFANPHATSELFLLEEIKKANGFIEETNIYGVAQYKDIYTDEYIKNMFAHFNVVSKEMALKMSEEEKLLFGWAYRRKFYFKTLKYLSESKLLLIEAEYLEAKITLLSKLGPYGVAIINSFNELKKKAESILGTTLTARDLNDLLDMIVEQYGDRYKENTKNYYALLLVATKKYQNDTKLALDQNSEKAKETVKSTSKYAPMNLSIPKAKFEKYKYIKVKPIDGSKAKGKGKGKPKKKSKETAPVEKEKKATQQTNNRTTPPATPPTSKPKPNVEAISKLVKKNFNNITQSTALRVGSTANSNSIRNTHTNSRRAEYGAE